MVHREREREGYTQRDRQTDRQTCVYMHTHNACRRAHTHTADAVDSRARLSQCTASGARADAARRAWRPPLSTATAQSRFCWTSSTCWWKPNNGCRPCWLRSKSMRRTRCWLTTPTRAAPSVAGWGTASPSAPSWRHSAPRRPASCATATRVPAAAATSKRPHTHAYARTPVCLGVWVSVGVGGCGREGGGARAICRLYSEAKSGRVVV
jgi:hypothetical protein